MGNVILIGYMGCGKSSVGVKLSYRLKQPFLDTDKMIENRAGKMISEIFDEEGEAYFRNLETETITELLNQKHWYIISTGGGLPMRSENREVLKKLGKVIYLRTKPETIYNRLKGDTTRPLLRGDDPLGKITEMISQRGPVYEEAADEIIDVDKLSFEQILSKISQMVSNKEIKE